MVAYSFQPQFVQPILAGTKRQTIRVIGRRRHAQPGDIMQLYTGMRTRQCSKVAEVACEDAYPVALDLVQNTVDALDNCTHRLRDLNYFAQRDGFLDWEGLKAFWAKHHRGVLFFRGLLVSWYAPSSPATCRVCGCTDADCSQCVQRTGGPCWWVERDLCSACAE